MTGCHPSEEEIARDFARERAAFESARQKLADDSHLDCVADGWYRLRNPSKFETGRLRRASDHLSAERWEEYRSLLDTIGKFICQSESGIFLVRISSWGFAFGGSTVSVVHDPAGRSGSGVHPLGDSWYVHYRYY